MQCGATREESRMELTSTRSFWQFKFLRNKVVYWHIENDDGLLGELSNSLARLDIFVVL